MKRLLFNIKKISLILIKIYTGYYFIYGIYLLVLKLINSKRSNKFPIRYVKEFPFHLNHKAIHRIRLTTQFIFTCLTTALITLIFLDNLAPLGLSIHYSSSENKFDISPFGPRDRIQQEFFSGTTVIKQIDNFIYFTTKMPFMFDKADIKITYKNPGSEQSMLLGFQDKESWHYQTQLLDAPLLDMLTWNKIGSHPVLYQKQSSYTKVNDFLKTPPKNALIGTYEYDADFSDTSFLHLNNYHPSNTNTVINTQIRGKITFYAYLENEPFRLSFQKQDLNWYDDPDPVTVKVYKGDEIVYQVFCDDDGISDDSKKTLPPQTVSITNPGPELPENGVYKIVIEAGSDTVIKNITTNLHKIVFQGNLFLAANSQSYPSITDKTQPTTIFTNALLFSANAVHNTGLQDIRVGSSLLRVNSINLDYTIIPKENFTAIYIPNNDVIIRGFQGYFAFSKDQFFVPTKYYIVPIVHKEDFDLVDYVLADYEPSKKVGDWQISERIFDIRSAYIKDGKMTWTIQAPKLKENNNSIIIKNVEVTFIKNSWFTNN